MHRKRSTLGTRKNIKPPVPVQQASTSRRRLGSGSVQRQRPERLKLPVAKRRLQWPADSTQKNKNEGFGHQNKQTEPFYKKPNQLQTIAKTRKTNGPAFKFGYVSNNSRKACGIESYQPRNMSLFQDKISIPCSPRRDISEEPALIKSSSSQRVDFNEWRRVTSKDITNQNSAEPDLFRKICSSSDYKGAEGIAAPVLLQSSYSRNKSSCWNGAGESTAVTKFGTSSTYRKMGSINSPFVLNSNRSQRFEHFLPQVIVTDHCDGGDFTNTIKLPTSTKSEIPVKTYKFTYGETENKDADRLFKFGTVTGLEDLSSRDEAEIFSRNLNNAESLKVTALSTSNMTPSCMKLRNKCTELSNRSDLLHNLTHVNTPTFNKTPSSMKLRSKCTELSNRSDSLHNLTHVNTPTFNKTPSSMKLGSKCTGLSNRSDSLHNLAHVNTPTFNKTPSSMKSRSKYTEIANKSDSLRNLVYGNTKVPKQYNYVLQTPLHQKREKVNDVPELSRSVGIKIIDAPLLLSSSKTYKFKSCTDIIESVKSEININNEQSNSSAESDDTFTERPRWPATLEKFTEFWNPVSSLSQTAHYKRKEFDECSIETSVKPDDKETKKKETNKCTISIPQSSEISPKLKKSKLQYGSPDTKKSHEVFKIPVECQSSLRSSSNVSEMHIVTSPFPLEPKIVITSEQKGSTPGAFRILDDKSSNTQENITEQKTESSNYLTESMEMDICQVACTSFSNTVSRAEQTKLTFTDMDDLACMKTTLGNVLIQVVQQKEHMNSLFEQQEQFKIQREQFKNQQEQFKLQQEQFKTLQEQFKTQQEQFKTQQEQFKTQEEQFETLCRKNKVELQDFQQRSNAIENEIKKIVSILDKKPIDDRRNEDTLKKDNSSISGVRPNGSEKSRRSFKRFITRTPQRRSARIAAHSAGAVSASSSCATPVTGTPENLMSDKDNCFSGSESLPLCSTTGKALDKSMKLYTELRSNFTFLKTPKTEKKLCNELSCAKTPNATPRRVLSQRIHDQLLSLYE